MSRIKCWVSFQEETKLRLTELIVYFIGGIVCQDDKLGVCVQQPSKCHIKCVKTDSRGCKPGTIKRDFTPIWFVPACGMSAKLSPLIELTPGEWENGINGHNGHYASEQTWLSEVCEVWPVDDGVRDEGSDDGGEGGLGGGPGQLGHLAPGGLHTVLRPEIISRHGPDMLQLHNHIIITTASRLGLLTDLRLA